MLDHSGVFIRDFPRSPFSIMLIYTTLAGMLLLSATLMQGVGRGNFILRQLEGGICRMYRCHARTLDAGVALLTRKFLQIYQEKRGKEKRENVFWCFPLLKTNEICFGSSKMGIFYLEKAFHAGIKIRKNDFAPPLKKIPLTPLREAHLFDTNMWYTPKKQGTSDILSKNSFW